MNTCMFSDHFHYNSRSKHLNMYASRPLVILRPRRGLVLGYFGCEVTTSNTTTSVCFFFFFFWSGAEDSPFICGGLKWFQGTTALSFYRLSYTERMSIICFYYACPIHIPCCWTPNYTRLIFIYYAYIRNIICVESVDSISNSESTSRKEKGQVNGR